MIIVRSLVCQVALTDCKYSYLAPRSDEKKVLASSVLQMQQLVCCLYGYLKLITAGGKCFMQVCFLMMRMLYSSIISYSVGKGLISLSFLLAVYSGFEQQSSLAIELFD